MPFSAASKSSAGIRSRHADLDAIFILAGACRCRLP
jgi:hypothetical protein